MSKIIYDVIQRFEVENGVPRLVSTNIQVIQGGEDLLSLAINLLTQMGFYDKFEEKRTSQYVGYRLKNPGKGDKRYQLVLAQRKEGLYVSIAETIIQLYLVVINFDFDLNVIKLLEQEKEIGPDFFQPLIYWIIPSKENQIFEHLGFNRDKLTLFFSLDNFDCRKLTPFTYPGNHNVPWPIFESFKESLNLMKLQNWCLQVNQDKLFPYMRQVSLSSSDVLEEFLNFFVKVIMEQN